jgi:hypothetical protein
VIQEALVLAFQGHALPLLPGSTATLTALGPPPAGMSVLADPREKVQGGDAQHL